MTTRQQLDEEMEKIKTRCDILVDLFKNGRITFNELQSTKNILLHNMQDSIIRIVTAALEEMENIVIPNSTPYNLKQLKYNVYLNNEINKILNSL